MKQTALITALLLLTTFAYGQRRARPVNVQGVKNDVKMPVTNVEGERFKVKVTNLKDLEIPAPVVNVPATKGYSEIAYHYKKRRRLSEGADIKISCPSDRYIVIETVYPQNSPVTLTMTGFQEGAVMIFNFAKGKWHDNRKFVLYPGDTITLNINNPHGMVYMTGKQYLKN